MLRKINIMYKETIWSSEIVDNNDQIDKNSSSIEELLQIVPNEEEKQKLLNDLENVAKEEKKEIKDFCEKEIKPALSDFKENLLNSDFYEKAKDKMNELSNKISQISEKKEKTAEDMENMRRHKVIASMLKVSKS